jgi:hypothetical protein
LRFKRRKIVRTVAIVGGGASLAVADIRLLDHGDRLPRAVAGCTVARRAGQQGFLVVNGVEILRSKKLVTGCVCHQRTGRFAGRRFA